MSDTCLKCQNEIGEGAVVCPECGYEPRSEGKVLRQLFYVIGGILTATLVGAVIGIPMIGLAYYSGKQVEGRKPSTHSPAP